MVDETQLYILLPVKNLLKNIKGSFFKRKVDIKWKSNKWRSRPKKGIHKPAVGKAENPSILKQRYPSKFQVMVVPGAAGGGRKERSSNK